MKSPGHRVNLRAPGLSERQRHVLLYIAFRDGNGEGCWASQETMSNETGIPERSLRRIISSLKALGHVSVQRRKQKTAVIRIAQERPPSGQSRKAPRPAKLVAARTATLVADKRTEHTSPSPFDEAGTRRPLSRVGGAPPASSSSLAPEGGVSRDDDAAPPCLLQATGGLRRLAVGAGMQPGEVVKRLPPSIREVEAAAADDARLIRSLRADLDHDAIVAIAAVLMKQWQILGSQFAPWLRDQVGTTWPTAEAFVKYGVLLRDGKIDVIPPDVERAFAEHLEVSHAA